MVILACMLTIGSGVVPLRRNYDGPDSTAVPIELVDGHRAVVLATLNGRGPYRLGVETGSPNVQLSPRLVRELALTRAGTSARDSLFRLDALRIGDVVVKGLEVGSDEGLERIGVDGVHGSDPLLAFRWTPEPPGRSAWWTRRAAFCSR
jgi:hypothetical protein